MNFKKADKLFQYDPESGELIRKVYRCGRAIDKAIAGNHRSDGYIDIYVDGTNYKAHRIIWLLNYGTFPINEIDHIDGNPSNNRLNNLRAVTHCENTRNSKLRKNNFSGCMGVCFEKSRIKWFVTIYSRKQIFLGRFNDFFEACCARKSAEAKYGYHKNHGRVEA